MILDRQMQLSFIHAIFSDLDDDAPRLIYSDWLDDQGDSLLSELVRVQTKLRRPDSHSHRTLLQQREYELLANFGFDRPGRTAQEIRDNRYTALPGGWNFAIVDCVPLLFITSLYPALALPPREWVERFGWFVVRLGTFDSYEHRYELEAAPMRALLDWPEMQHCIGFDLNNVERSDEAVQALMESPLTPSLLRLDLSECDIDADCVLAAERLPNLLELNLARAGFFRDAWETFLGRAASRSIRRLGLADCTPPRTPVGITQDLANARGLANLVELDLSGTDLTDGQARLLSNSRFLPKLHTLRLARTNIGNSTVAELCQSERWFRSGEWSFFECPITDEALVLLAGCSHSVHLRSLSIGHAEITDTGVLAIAESPYLKNIRELTFLVCKIGPVGARALTGGISFPRLEFLRLGFSPIGDEGALALARWQRQRECTGLDLFEVGLTTDGVTQLVESGLLAGLERLSITGNPIGDEGIAVLARCPALASLRSFDLSTVGMTDRGAHLLAQSPYLEPGLRLWWYDAAMTEAGREVLRERFLGG